MSAPTPYVHQLTATCYDNGGLCGKVHEPMPLGSEDSPAAHAIARALENPELISDLYWVTEDAINDATRISTLAEVARHLAAVAEHADNTEGST